MQILSRYQVVRICQIIKQDFHLFYFISFLIFYGHVDVEIDKMYHVE